MAFLIQQVDGGRIPGIEYLPAGAITPKVGMALTQTGGNLAVASGTTTPTYISMVSLLMLSALLRLEADHPHHIIDLYLFALEWELFAVRAGYRFEHFFL